MLETILGLVISTQSIWTPLLEGFIHWVLPSPIEKAIAKQVDMEEAEKKADNGEETQLDELP